MYRLNFEFDSMEEAQKFNQTALKELVRILAENGYEVTVKKIGNYWEHKYRVEVSVDESSISDSV